MASGWVSPGIRSSGGMPTVSLVDVAPEVYEERGAGDNDDPAAHGYPAAGGKARPFALFWVHGN